MKDFPLFTIYSNKELKLLPGWTEVVGLDGLLCLVVSGVAGVGCAASLAIIVNHQALSASRTFSPSVGVVTA